MNRKQLASLAAFALLAATGTAARADDITMVADHFMSTKSRAEVRAETLKAIADGSAFVSEVDLASTMLKPMPSAVSREQVRAEVGERARRFAMMWYPA